MININFTLLIELILFFFFFIFTRKFVWKPLLQTIKQREEHFKGKEKEIKKVLDEANTLREEYKKKIQQTQKSLDSRIDNIIRNAYVQQRTLIEEKQKEAHEQLLLFRNELQKQFCIDNTVIETHAEVLSEKIIQCLIQQKRIF